MLGWLLPPSPPAEKATARQDQAGQSSTRDGARVTKCIPISTWDHAPSEMVLAH